MTPRLLKIELAFVFGLLPLMISIAKPHGWIAFILWGLSVASWQVLRKEGYSWAKEWNRPALTRSAVKSILWRFAPCAALILAFTCIKVPEQLFSLPRERPHIWVMVMFLYPLLSVIPQEIIFRSFFLKRYEPLMTGFRLRAANALAFGWVHVILQNWVAMLFCAMGGWMFADTYCKTRSLAAACFEHSLYGCYVFTIGLGVFFYHGAAVH